MREIIPCQKQFYCSAIMKNATLDHAVAKIELLLLGFNQNQHTMIISL